MIVDITAPAFQFEQVCINTLVAGLKSCCGVLVYLALLSYRIIEELVALYAEMTGHAIPYI